MNYKLTIERSEPNPEYKPPKGLSGIYHDRYDISPVINRNVLSVELTEEEFKSVKREVFKTFE
jgi:hypothetical protein